MYLQFLGLYPTQSRSMSNLITAIIICSLISIMIPAISQIAISIIEKNLDAAIESIPVVAASTISITKVLNHKINKEKYDNLFVLINQEWEFLKYEENQPIYVLDNITKQGHVLGEAYRTALLLFMVFYLFVPLVPQFMDIILPLNETRQRQQVLRLQYFVDDDEYFYSIYFHNLWCSFIIVIVTVSMDSLRMILIHHVCGLFAVCGHQIGKMTEDNFKSRTLIEKVKKCVVIHKKALRFHEIIDNSSRTSYFIIILFTMTGLIVTGVQAVLYLHKPEEALRIILFLLAQQFHLLVVTLPGQVILDYSLDLATDVYCSAWYRMPANIQKMLYVIQIRSSKPCSLTAGGVYELNIENFGTTFRTCVSYFMVLLSFKE